MNGIATMDRLQGKRNRLLVNDRRSHFRFAPAGSGRLPRNGSRELQRQTLDAFEIEEALCHTPGVLPGAGCLCGGHSLNFLEGDSPEMDDLPDNDFFFPGMDG